MLRSSWMRNLCSEPYAVFSFYRQIMHEYFDCSARASRLAPSKEGFLMNNDSGADEVFLDDIYIYLRWYVSHLHSLMLYNKICRVSYCFASYRKL